MPKKSTKSKKPLKSLDQAHGKDESKRNPTTLDQIWGDTGLWRYKTQNVVEYKQQIQSMTLADIRDHAVKIGLVPAGDRVALEKKLVNEFKKHISKYNSAATEPEEAPKISDEARKILKEGQ